MSRVHAVLRVGFAGALFTTSVAGAQTIAPAAPGTHTTTTPVAPARPPLTAAANNDKVAPQTVLAPISVQALALPDISPELAIEPVTVVSGTDLIRQRTQSLGDTLARTPGVSAANFGAGVGRPVIRGQSGARVRVQENGLASADVSTISQDHAVTIDPYSASQIEVLKGPQTLLYGSGAIGGVVNVVTNRIPQAVPEGGVSGNAVLERSDAAQGERLEHLDVTAGHGPIAVNVQGLKRLTDDYDANDNRRIDNSATDTSNYSAGGSVIGDWGFVGGAASHFGRTYGIPNEDSHIDMGQNRYDLRGQINDPIPGFSKLDFSGAYTDYQHTEGVDTPEATFKNRQTEIRVAGTHVPIAGFTGVVGLQGSKRDYEALGEEQTFVPPTTTDSIAAFWVEERPIGDNWTVQGGARVEYNNEDTSLGRKDTDSVPFSVSLGARRDIGDSYVATASVGHYERAPATEELYSFGPHEATQAFERGDQGFGVEKSDSVELGFRKIKGRARFDTSVYYTHFKNYIYLASVDGGLNADGSGTPNADGVPDQVNDEGIFERNGELQLLNFSASDATFFGGEGKVSYDLLTGAHTLTASIQGDYVRADLDNGTNLPRITPARYGASLDYDDTRFVGNFQVLQTSQPDHLAPEEVGSASYTEMNAFAGYKIPSFDKTKALVYLRGDNLLDEDIIRQTSFLRVSQPGRTISTGISVTF